MQSGYTARDRFSHDTAQGILCICQAIVLNIIEPRREKTIILVSDLFPCKSSCTAGMKNTVQEFLLHHDLLGVQIFHIMEKGLFIVQMIKSKANNVCMRGQDN